MTQEIKTAIKSAEQRLEDEQTTKIQEEVYEYLKYELGEIENLKNQVRTLESQLRVHEENVKNVKTGNLEAIEKRRKALNQPAVTTWTFTSTLPANYSGYRFYDNYVAGFTYTSPLTGRTYIF